MSMPSPRPAPVTNQTLLILPSIPAKQEFSEVDLFD
jgi:hypothetical protein